MAITRIERNKIYKAIVAGGLDPAECRLDESDDDLVAVIHNGSSSTVSYISDITFIPPEEADVTRWVYKVNYHVVDGHDYVYETKHKLGKVMPIITQWADEVRQTFAELDHWAEMRCSRELIADVQEADSDNAPFTEDEQRQIAAQLQGIKNQLREQFELNDEQVTQIEERFDEAEEASKRMGRKDWLLLFGGTILNLIVTDTVTPGVAGHIFTTVVQGVAHLFTGGPPPQILA